MDAWRPGRSMLVGGLLRGHLRPVRATVGHNLLRRTAPGWPMSLLFSTNFGAGFDPAVPAGALKNCIHRMAPGEAIHDFMAADQAARETVAHKTWDRRSVIRGERPCPRARRGV